MAPEHLDRAEIDGRTRRSLVSPTCSGFRACAGRDAE
jgi:hypothetical protein